MATNNPHSRDVPFKIQELIETQEYSFNKLFRENHRNFSAISDILTRIETLESQPNNTNRQAWNSCNEKDQGCLEQENNRMKAEIIGLKNEIQLGLNNPRYSIPQQFSPNMGGGIQQDGSPDNAQLVSTQRQVQDLQRELQSAREEISCLKQPPASMGLETFAKANEDNIRDFQKVNPRCSIMGYPANQEVRSINQDGPPDHALLERTQSKVQELEEELQLVRREFQSMKQTQGPQAQQQEFIQSLLSEKDYQSSKLNECENRISKLEVTLGKSEERCSDLKVEHGKAVEQRDQLFKFCEQRKRSYSQLEVDKQSFEKAIQSRDAMIHSLQQQITEKQTIIETQEVSQRMFENDFAKSEAKWKAQDHDVLTYKGKLLQKDEEISTLHLRIEKDKNIQRLMTAPYPTGPTYLPPTDPAPYNRPTH